MIDISPTHWPGIMEKPEFEIRRRQMDAQATGEQQKQEVVFLSWFEQCLAGSELFDGTALEYRFDQLVGQASADFLLRDECIAAPIVIDPAVPLNHFTGLQTQRKRKVVRASTPIRASFDHGHFFERNVIGLRASTLQQLQEYTDLAFIRTGRRSLFRGYTAPLRIKEGDCIANTRAHIFRTQA